MSVNQRVALLGFSAFERETLEAGLRLAGTRVRLCAATDDLGSYALIVADADHPASVHTVGSQGRVHDTLFIGATRLAGHPAARLPRPIDALAVQRELDAILRRRAETAADANRPRSERRNARPSGRALQQAQHPEVQDFRHSSSGGYSNSVLQPGDLRLDTVLVASDSPVEQQLLRETLVRLGYRVDMVRRGEEAIAQSSRHDYRFVFLGVGMRGADPFQTCRQIKRRPNDWGAPPTVVQLARQPTSVERIRATFAGCDAYLGGPLHDDQLLKLLATHDATFERVFEPTGPLAM